MIVPAQIGLWRPREGSVTVVAQGRGEVVRRHVRGIRQTFAELKIPFGEYGEPGRGGHCFSVFAPASEITEALQIAAVLHCAIGSIDG